MRTVEDGIELIAQRISREGNTHAYNGMLSDAWTSSFINSVSTRISKSNPLSTQQSKICLKLISKVAGHLIGDGLTTSDEVTRLLSRPTYRITPYQSTNIPREVVHMGDDRLAFRFKWDATIVQEIKALGLFETRNRPLYDAQYGIWLVSITRHTIDPVMHIITKHSFSFGNDVVNYLERCTTMRNKPSVATMDDTGLILLNIHDNTLLAAWAMHVEDGEMV